MTVVLAKVMVRVECCVIVSVSIERENSEVFCVESDCNSVLDDAEIAAFSLIDPSECELIKADLNSNYLVVDVLVDVIVMLIPETLR